jgi:cyanophycinase-like exopeptidase
VRQGSILGPVLFLVLISDMASALGIGDDENVVYADDTTVRQAGKTVAEVIDKLTVKAARFAEWLRGSSLTMNASKTQLLLTGDWSNGLQRRLHGRQPPARLPV